MAFNPTLLEASADTNAADATVISTGSVSPDDSQKHFLAVLVSGTAQTPSVAGCGLTWAEEHSLDYADAASPSRRLMLFEGTGTVSGTPDTVDMTFGSAPSGVAWILFDSDGLDDTTPLVEFVDDLSDVGVNTLTTGDLTDFTDTPTDGTLVVFGKNQNNVNTLEGGWTQLGHAGFDTPASSMTVLWRSDPDLQNVMSWTGTAKCGAFIVRMGGATAGGTATQSSTYLAEINRLLSRGGRIAARLLARRRAGVDITDDLAALRAVYSDLYPKHDELLVESLDIDDPITRLGSDRDTLLLNAGDPGVDPPTPVALLKGLMARAVESGNAAVEHYNPEITWAELQPLKGGAIDTDVIGDLITAGDSFRVRLFNGYGIPQWVKDEVGTVTTYYAQTPDTRAPEDVARYWDPLVATYYDDLMQKLAAEYDGVIPLIFEAMCMTVYAEPCLKQFNYAPNRTAYLAAGYTSAADLEAFNNALDIMAAHWHETRVGVAYNGYQLLTSTGGTTTSNAQTKTLMQRHRSLFGERAVLQNNSIRESYLANPSATFTDMAELGPPISFQTATLARVGDLGAVLDWCIDEMGAHAVEWPGQGNLTQAELNDFNTRLRANP